MTHTRGFGECPYTAMCESKVYYFEPPVDFSGTVFDPTDEVFGPIMAAIQRGDFVEAARDLLALERRLTVGPL